jgi:hypothetical protein
MQLAVLFLVTALLPSYGTIQDTVVISRPSITIRVVTPPPPPADTQITKPIAPGAPLLVELAKRSRHVSSDTLFVYSAIGRSSWPFVGEPLDTTFESLFQPFYPSLAFPHAEPELFVVARLVLDPQHIGYLLRVPGMYEASRIDLWIYDAGRHRFGVPIQIAEAWGDEGCGYDLVALLVDINRDRRRDLVLYQATGCSDMETGRTISEADSLWVRTWTAGGFSARVQRADSLLLNLLQAQRPQAVR